MARITINDIARLSGYSKTSVSFAFNDPGRISEKARTRILSIARELGYIPDPLARSLSLRKHSSIGLLLPEIIPLAFLNSHLSQIVQGIGAVCEQAGYSLTLIPPLKESILEGIRSAAVDGLITIGLEPGMDTAELIKQRHLPFVTIDGRVGGGFPVVGIDDKAAAIEMIRYVIAQGHQDIGIISFLDEPKLETRSFVKNQRLSGYRSVLTDPEISWNGNVRWLESESSMSGGAEVAEFLLEEGALPTAIVAMSDVIALGVMECLEENGIAVPEHVSVTGFDDIPEARLVRPQLTTISQSGIGKGKYAAEILMQLIAGHTVEQHHVLDTNLIERASCAAPNARIAAR